MRRVVVGGLLLVAGCASDRPIADGAHSAGSSALGSAGASGQGHAGSAGGHAGHGSAGSSAGRGGSSAGRGGSAAASAGSSAGGAGGAAGSNGDCDCVRGAYVPVCGTDGRVYDATCGDECVPVPIACRGMCPCDEPSALHWYTSCGAPVCNSDPDPFDDPTIPNCTTEEEGATCSEEGNRCDGVASCGATLVCAKSDPTMGPGGCPISRARFKDDIAYLSERQLREYHTQLIGLPLASYRYTRAPAAGPQLGFIIEDIEPSVAVSGDHVNMYGYLSMAVAAIQVQQEQITALQRELESLRAREPDGAEGGACMP